MKTHTIFIAGAGGIGRAAGLLLRELGDFQANLILGDIFEEANASASEFITGGSNRPGKTDTVVMPREGSSDPLETALAQSDILLDCLPGSQAPRMSRFAQKHGLHYVNLTEYVAETEQIKEIAADAQTGFILQAGLAPGYICILANHLYQQFQTTTGLEKVESIQMKVGALTRHALPPHYTDTPGVPLA